MEYKHHHVGRAISPHQAGTKAFRFLPRGREIAKQSGFGRGQDSHAQIEGDTADAYRVATRLFSLRMPVVGQLGERDEMKRRLARFEEI